MIQIRLNEAQRDELQALRRDRVEMVSLVGDNYSRGPRRNRPDDGGVPRVSSSRQRARLRLRVRRSLLPDLALGNGAIGGFVFNLMRVAASHIEIHSTVFRVTFFCRRS